MKKLLNTILISTVFIYCNDVYSSNVNTMYYDALSSSYDNICNYKIDDNKTIDNIPNNLYGALYAEKDNNKYYIVDNDGKYYFDLHTKIGEVIENDKELPNFNEGGNLIIKQCDNNSNTYTLKQQTTKYNNLTLKLLKDTNLIIPNNITLNCNDVVLKFYGNNCNLLILGTLKNTFQTARKTSCIYGDKDSNFNIIIGPHAIYNWNSVSSNSPIRMISLVKHNMVLYPGCELQCLNAIPDDNDKIAIKHGGNLYLSRYITPDSIINPKLKGIIDEYVHIIYPEEFAEKTNNEMLKFEYGLIKDCSGKNYDTTAYFPALYWYKTGHSYAKTGGGKYHFENPSAPIAFIDDGNGHKILGLNATNNKFAKYDVKLLD